MPGGGSLILCHTGLGASVFDGCDQYSTSLDFNGDDALALVRDDHILDVIGQQGDDPGTGWQVGGVADATRDHTLVRASSVVRGNVDWASSRASEWVVYAGEKYGVIGASRNATGTECSMFSAGNYTCLCADGYVGSNCDDALDECSSSPCQNLSLIHI